MPKNVDFSSWNPKVASGEKRECIKASTKGQCISKKFPNHAAWPSHVVQDDLGWWSTVRKKLEKEATRTQNRNETEEDTSVYSLFLENYHSYSLTKRPVDDPIIAKFNWEISSVDMEAISHHAMKQFGKGCTWSPELSCSALGMVLGMAEKSSSMTTVSGAMMLDWTWWTWAGLMSKNQTPTRWR